MFAMRESTNNDMHKMEKGMDINATDSFDVVGSLGSGGEQLSMVSEWKDIQTVSYV